MSDRLAMNGTAAYRSGYWIDGDGHRVFVQRHQIMPACPAQPFRATVWMLHTEIAATPAPDAS